MSPKRREINEEKCGQQPEAFVGNETLLFSLNSTPYPTPDIWKEWLIMFTASRRSQIPDCMALDRQRQKQGFGSDGKTRQWHEKSDTNARDVTRW